MRQNLARNCTLREVSEPRKKNKILPNTDAEMIANQGWSPEQTLSKLQEMTKISSFKGFKSTKDAGEAFIMEKVAFLLYLAHTKFVQD
jgi:hypothetical protein